MRPPFLVIARRAQRAAAIQLAVFGSAFCAHAADVAFKFTEPKGAPIADVVVSLIPLDAPVKVTPPTEPLEIAQSGQEFSTLVTPLVVGSTVVFPNADKVSHQVYSLSKPTKVFTLPLYKPGDTGKVVFDRPGVVALGCNIHDWMLAYVVVLETPWFAKSAIDGVALLSAPTGRYRAEVWHRRLAKIETREITVTDPPGGTLAKAEHVFTLTLKPDRSIRRAPASGAGGYK